jgi:hypothetical protein
MLKLLPFGERSSSIATSVGFWPVGLHSTLFYLSPVGDRNPHVSKGFTGNLS